MHIHLPKPLHNWREFVSEIGIIVIGILLALTAEQIAENWHWEKQAREAREALRSEVQDDDLPQAYARLAMAPCIDVQLEDLQRAFDNQVDRSQFAALTRAYSPPVRTWDDEAWKAVVATGVLAHGGSEELIRWSLPYRMVKEIGPRNAEEHSAVVNLKSISHAPGKLTPAELDRVVVALEHLRAAERLMVSGSRVLLAGAAQAGVQLTAAQEKHFLQELRLDWGPCVTKPIWRKTNINTQSEQQFKGDETYSG